jgi:hypothetical protein
MGIACHNRPIVTSRKRSRHFLELRKNLAANRTTNTAIASRISRVTVIRKASVQRHLPADRRGRATALRLRSWSDLLAAKM